MKTTAKKVQGYSLPLYHLTKALIGGKWREPDFQNGKALYTNVGWMVKIPDFDVDYVKIEFMPKENWRIQFNKNRHIFGPKGYVYLEKGKDGYKTYLQEDPSAEFQAQDLTSLLKVIQGKSGFKILANVLKQALEKTQEPTQQKAS